MPKYTLFSSEIKAAKRAYKERVEKPFQEGNARDAWQGVKTLAGLPKNSATLNAGTRDPVDMADDLNQFYCRFDQVDYTQERK